MVEGDGSIKIPTSLRSQKGKLLYPSVTIIFAKKDYNLAKFLSAKLEGTISKSSGDWFVLSLYKLSSLDNFANLVNGKFKTPKVEALHRLIDWLNQSGKFDTIKPLPIDESDIISTGWLAGFSDSDSNFLISFSKSELGLAKNIRLTYRLSQRQEYHRSLFTSYLDILSEIAKLFKTKVTSYERKRLNPKNDNSYVEKGYLITVVSLSSREELIKYFTKFPLLSSKGLDYLNWVEAHNLVIKRQYRTISGSMKLEELKNSMNNKRIIFNWEHLENL